MNKHFLSGNLVKDPEMRKTQNDVSVCTFTLAVNRRHTDKDGNRIADFFNIVTWRGQAENCYRYLKKGSRVAVVGETQNRSYTDKDGQKRWVTEVQAEDVEFLDKKKEMQEVQDEDFPF